MRTPWTALGILLALVVLAACAEMRRGTEPHNDRELMTGPGLFTGPAGEWVIFKRAGHVLPSRVTSEGDGIR